MHPTEEDRSAADEPRRGRRFSRGRRSLLIGGAVGLGIAGVASATATATPPIGEAVQLALGVAPAQPVPQAGFTRVERIWSRFRRREVDLVTLLPDPAPPRNLPVSLLLHGLHGRARTAPPTGTVPELAAQVADDAVPAFGFVAVDGGDDYWHENHAGDDPMAMLLEEVPQWLRKRGLGDAAGLPFACTGMSMGGFGALLYARRRAVRRQPVDALALLAPALITSWSEMSKRGAFHSSSDWASMDPLRHPRATQAVATGVWCGTEDQFIAGARRFIAETRPEVAYTAPGKHGDSFNRTVVADVIGFLGRHVPTR
ncbi:alpha/beta hydrolase [Amycolatopsis pigmentata]|uniref:Alpha/beta hydrolase n=1 Tax=Amycolatopsis pigmentata TaxID=450801 RepID=A0ABW5G3G8_9PSEU